MRISLVIARFAISCAARTEEGMFGTWKSNEPCEVVDRFQEAHRVTIEP